MLDGSFGTTNDYLRAFQLAQKDGFSQKQIQLLREHFDAPNHTASAQQLAEKVGYSHYSAVNLQYGTLAGRVGRYMGLTEPPNGFWLFVLAKWADNRTESGDTAFVLRPEVIEALKRLGVLREPNPDA